ncbi:hypothetical protein C3D71_08235 [Cronobacter sakazakii]|nr:hypothetical protein C3D71_08235 [Cronobacter sakazakii]
MTGEKNRNAYLPDKKKPLFVSGFFIFFYLADARLMVCEKRIRVYSAQSGLFKIGSRSAWKRVDVVEN